MVISSHPYDPEKSHHQGGCKNTGLSIFATASTPGRKETDYAEEELSHPPDSLPAQSIGLGIPLDQMPHDYGEYIQFLKDKYGVKLYANRTMMLLYKIPEDATEPAVTPIGLEKIVELFENSDVSVAY